ncbi:uncharacterized protein ASCRUDRAFT_76249 [Ascoidea rubescens DSM 1968]|uniref:Uncharacterized protein n=1 Tax=Ascoidea rubescens DSM 1968 TaxID=1344418 RepID=A0A1D2VGV4_9ASCO|nr:hypothetical protein ASCRUDRAFT_76249 [Ascoidea rubescens DSM 1968]ODV60901.1 hypothetical protein ASCRUDRAFT_76249 [Ascoidea rubescens DSM 1968]
MDWIQRNIFPKNALNKLLNELSFSIFLLFFYTVLLETSSLLIDFPFKKFVNFKFEIADSCGFYSNLEKSEIILFFPDMNHYEFKFDGSSTPPFQLLNKEFENIRQLFAGLDSHEHFRYNFTLAVKNAIYITDCIGANYHTLNKDVGIVESALDGFGWMKLFTQLDAVELLKEPGVIDIKRMRELLDLHAELEKWVFCHHFFSTRLNYINGVDDANS